MSLEILEEVKPGNPDQMSSVEYSVNAKGLLSGKIKVYDADIDKAHAKAMEHRDVMEKEIQCKNQPN